MRVLVNAASSKMGGAVTYLRDLLRAVARESPAHHFTVYVPESTRRELEPVVDPAVVRLCTYPYARTSGPERVYFDQVLVPGIARRMEADALFSATGFGTFRTRLPQVLLVPNALYFGEAGGAGAAERLRRALTSLSIRAADVVLFPTGALRDAALPLLRPDRQRVQVLHYGYDETLLRPVGPVPQAAVDAARWRREGETVLLYVSSYAVHKNFETLVEALPRLSRAGHRVRLVTTLSREVTGARDEYDRLAARIAELGLEETVVRAGHLPPAQLAHLYAGADLFVFPSTKESFGFPMVEALCAGLPVVAASTPVNREILADAAVYFSPLDADACANAIAALVSDPARRADGARRAAERALRFSWAAYAREFLQLLDAAVARRPRLESMAA